MAISPSRKTLPAHTSLYALLGVNFIGALGLSLVLPFLVYIVKAQGGTSILYGILGAMYPAFQLVGAPLLGKLSDKLGRRRVLLFSQGGTLFSWLIFALALWLPVGNTLFIGLSLPLFLIFCARAFDGLTGGNVAVANAYLADITPKEERKRYFGQMSAAANAGFILGPAVAGLLGGTSLGFQLPVWVAALVSLLGLLLILIGLPKAERRPHGEEMPFRQLISEPIVGYLLLLYFLLFLGFNIFYTAFPLHAASEAGLNWNAGRLGIYFACLSGLMILVQGPVMSRLGPKFSEQQLIFAGSALLAINFVLLRWQHPLPVWAAIVFFALGNGLMWPSVLSLLSQLVNERQQGAVQGLAGSVGGLASIIGLLLGGYLYDMLSNYTFWFAAGLIGLVSLLSLRLFNIQPSEQR